MNGGSLGGQIGRIPGGAETRMACHLFASEDRDIWRSRGCVYKTPASLGSSLSWLSLSLMLSWTNLLDLTLTRWHSDHLSCLEPQAHCNSTAPTLSLVETKQHCAPAILLQIHVVHQMPFLI